MIVVDNSIATKWVFPEEESDLALALLADHVARGERVVGPHLLPIEFTNVVRKQMRQEGLSHDDAVASLDRFFAFPIELRPRSDAAREALHRRAVTIAERYDLPATYDAHYLALAETLKCDLWTADQRLLRQMREGVAWLHPLGEYQPTR